MGVPRRYPVSVAEASARVVRGEPFWQSFGSLMEFLKYNATQKQRYSGLAEEPPTLGDAGLDALVAAMAEDLAMTYEVPVPEWCLAGRYHLPPGQEYCDWRSPRGRAYVIAHAREPYRRHGVFVAPNVIDIA